MHIVLGLGRILNHVESYSAELVLSSRFDGRHELGLKQDEAVEAIAIVVNAPNAILTFELCLQEVFDLALVVRRELTSEIEPNVGIVVGSLGMLVEEGDQTLLDCLTQELLVA
jgi:hypothetical protein